MNIDTSVVTFIVGVLVSNAAILIGFFVSLKVSNAVLDVKVGRLETDVKNLGNLYRESLNKEIKD